MVRILPTRLKPYSSGNNSAANSRSNSPMRNKGGDASGMVTPKDNGLALKIVAIKARGLAPKDKGGTSDPYLVLTLGESKETTHSVPKSLNPEWGVVCQMPIIGMQSLLLDVICWDKDRFGKDYLGEFELALEEIFVNEKTEQEPTWYPLKSKRPGKKTSVVSGEVLLQFTLLDATNKDATAKEIFEKLCAITGADLDNWASRNVTPMATPLVAPSASGAGFPGPSAATTKPSPPLSRSNTDPEEEDDGLDEEDETPEETEEGGPKLGEEATAAAIAKRKRRLRIKGLKKRKRLNAYEFTNGSDVVGIIYLEIVKITDLPPETNLTRTSFDMDPFVVASLGKRTFRTKVVRHNLNPVFNEKMIFQVLGHEQAYSFSFTVVDHDKYSGNDFIASAALPVKELVDKAPKADLETGLYDLQEPPEYVPAQRPRFIRLGMSRSSSSQSLNKVSRPPLSKSPSAAAVPLASFASASSSAAPQDQTVTDINQVVSVAGAPVAVATAVSPGLAPPPTNPGETLILLPAVPGPAPAEASDDDPDFNLFTVPLKMKNLDKWEAKHNPQLYIRAKYMPYKALRQQFWRAMLKQYDTDESGRISKVELTTMLDTLGSTLRESTIDAFFQRFPHKVAGSGDDITFDLTMEEAVLCLEDQLDARNRQPTLADRMRNLLPDADKVRNLLSVPQKGAVAAADAPSAAGSMPSLSQESSSLTTVTSGASGASGASGSTITPPSGSSLEPSQSSTIAVPELNTPGEEGEVLDKDDLNVDSREEHVVEIRECPICHQPRLNKRRDADIITHIATCASQDWRQVNSLVMAGFVTSSQAQRKWYSKVVTKISYGGYKLGANSANILVQDRLTGMINEEKMSVYVRLGIRLLYKGLKSNNMENKRIRKLLKGLSIKQGKKFDDPASKSEIQKFIEFHQLDMSEVLRPVEEFKTFNEFFYRALKPEARPCSAPDNPRIIVSPADSRSVVFNRVDVATKIWIKGRGFSIRRLLGDAYAEDAHRYEGGGALGIFRLAPQDYHRFHIPVDGVMGAPKTIAGEYYTVNPMAIRSALDVYGENVRVVVPIDSPEHGRVMVVCVGAMMVGSTVITRAEGENVKRAEELGYFKFGGSTLVVLFEEGKMKFDDDLADNSTGALEMLIRAGMSVGHSLNEPQWRQDMRRDAADVTAADMKDAKRRIQGSLSAEDSPDEDGGAQMVGAGKGSFASDMTASALAGEGQGPTGLMFS